jgi:uncharacterized membrane protein
MMILERNQFLRKYFFERKELDRILVLSCLFSLSLMTFRIIWTSSFYFIFLPWNLFLAWIPYTVSFKLGEMFGERKWKARILFFVWLLFIPNSFYIITDLFHLGGDNAPEWFDLALIFSFAWNGLLLGILSVQQMEKIISKRTGLTGLFFTYPLMWLIALGIYIGRFLRYNSWDILTNPFPLLGDIYYLMRHPFRSFEAWGMVFCFSVLMTLIYSTIKKINKES